MDNAYVHTGEPFEGVVSRIYTDSPSNIQCSDEDLRRVRLQRLRDETRRVSAACVSRSGPLASSSGGDEDQSFRPLFRTFLRPCYYMWLEVREDETFADPRDRQDEINELIALESEWRERRGAECRAREERLLRWREGLGDYDDVDDAITMAGAALWSLLVQKVSPMHHTSAARGYRVEMDEAACASYLSIGQDDAGCSSSYSALMASSSEICNSCASSVSDAYGRTSAPSRSLNELGVQSSDQLPDSDDGNQIACGLKAFMNSCTRALMSTE